MRCRVLCCKESTKDRMFKRGFSKFRHEIEIDNLMKTIRILKAHAKKSYSHITWRFHKLKYGIRRLHIMPKQDKIEYDKLFKM